ncbi:solute carrier family 26 protein [Flagellimonas sp. 389]|uniref:SulP family inorganic anion transporter n=1 Tax=Flagellimonas sp. 389 TaxID=2835862 RepID=UPI001BD6818A|nr:solute carrier family 26 protein [Flagellimonas sp. 389]MBS9462847.1 solute carrier family 26 protein [Flagellimonas sp. 389]
MLKHYFPFLDWITAYNRSFLYNDFIAGATLGVLLVPQGMAYAMIAGMPPIYGLYAALVPQVVYAITGTSRQLAVGPVAMDSLLVAAGIGALQLSKIEDYVAAVIFLTLIVGSIQLLLGFLKMGFFVNFLSKPVINGFTSAAAILIALGQLKHILGITVEQSSKLHILVANTMANITGANYYALGLGAGAMLVIFLLNKISKRMPTPLLAVVIGILVVFFFGLEEKNIRIVGEIPRGLPLFQMPDIQLGELGQLLPIALTVAIFGFMESISIAKTIEEKHPEYELDANQELRALGLSNLLGSFFQSFPVSGSFSRTAINDQAGAKTGMALIFSALFIACTLLFLTPLFYYLPNTVLGAIIIMSVVKLVNFHYPIMLYKQRKDEFLLLMITFLMTLFIGLMEGILLGVLFSLFLLVYRISNPHIAILGRIKNTEYFKNINRFDNIEVEADKLILRFDAQLYFGNKDYFKKELYRQIEKKGLGLKYVILNAEAINYIDSSAALAIERIVSDLRTRNIQFFIAGAIGPTRDIFFSSGLINSIGKKNLFARTFEAVTYCSDQKERSKVEEKISLQSKTGYL